MILPIIVKFDRVRKKNSLQVEEYPIDRFFKNSIFDWHMLPEIFKLFDDTKPLHTVYTE